MEESILRFLTIWTLIIFIATLITCTIFPNTLPLWFFIGIACLVISIGVVGTFFIDTICIYNKNAPVIQNVLIEDFIVHILPVIFLLTFYPVIKKRFYYTQPNIIKSAAFPLIISLIYLFKHDVEEIYSMSDLSTPVIVILTLFVWISSYPIFANTFREIKSLGIK